MLTNKIIDILITIAGFVVLPVQLVTTFLLGILVDLTCGLLLLPFDLLWMTLFYGPFLGLSYIWERVFFLRPLISIVGIPLAVVGDAYVCLLPSMGEMDSRCEKLLYCQTFPYTWRYFRREVNLDSYIDTLERTGKPSDELVVILLRISSKDPTIYHYLDVVFEQNTKTPTG